MGAVSTWFRSSCFSHPAPRSVIVPLEHLPHNGQWLRRCFEAVSLSFVYIYNCSTLNKTKLQTGLRFQLSCWVWLFRLSAAPVRLAKGMRGADPTLHSAFLAVCPGVGFVCPPRERGTGFSNWCAKLPSPTFFDIWCILCYGGHFSICTFYKLTSFRVLLNFHNKPLSKASSVFLWIFLMDWLRWYKWKF